MSVPAPDDSNPPDSGSSGGGGSASGAAGAVGGTGSTIGTQLSGVGTFAFSVVITSATQAVNLPGRTIAPDETVEISPVPTNAGNINVASSPSDALNGPNRLVLTPGSAQAPRTVNVGRLNELWVAGAVNDALLVVVRRKSAQ